MAFLFEAAACCVMALSVAAHQGTVTFSDTGVRIDGYGRKKISRILDYDQIQRLELGPAELRIRTYEDLRWQLGRDREYVFDRIAAGETAKLYSLLSFHLDQRFIARVPVPLDDPKWQAPAKMLRHNGGSNGELKIGAATVVFAGAGIDASRTWRYTDIANVSSSGAFELSITSLDGETRFQLKHPLPENLYDDLWRGIMQANGLKVFDSQLEGHHHE